MTRTLKTDLLTPAAAKAVLWCLFDGLMTEYPERKRNGRDIQAITNFMVALVDTHSPDEAEFIASEFEKAGMINELTAFASSLSSLTP